MRKNRELLLQIALFCCAINCFGCSKIDNYIRTQEEIGLEITTAKYDSIMRDLKQYVGKSTTELRRILGEPSKIIFSSNVNGVKYDEEWIYAKGVVLLNKQYRMFYITNDIVVHVEFGGVF